MLPLLCLPQLSRAHWQRAKLIPLPELVEAVASQNHRRCWVEGTHQDHWDQLLALCRAPPESHHVPERVVQMLLEFRQGLVLWPLPWGAPSSPQGHLSLQEGTVLSREKPHSTAPACSGSFIVPFILLSDLSNAALLGTALMLMG